MKKIFKKIVGILYVAVCSMLLFGITANAYIDPSVMTFLIQTVAGIIIAAGAVVGIFWRRAKKKVAKKLKIDENRNKEIESDDIDII